MTKEVKAITEGQRMLNEMKTKCKRRIDVDDIIAIEVLSGVSHAPIARALRQITLENPEEYMGIETIDFSEQLARMLYQLEIGDTIDSNPNSLKATNLYRIKGIWTPSEIFYLLKSPDEEKFPSPQKVSKADYVLGKDIESDELNLFSWDGSHFDGIWGLPDYFQTHENEQENNKNDEDYSPEIGDVVSVTDEDEDLHHMKIQNAVSSKTLVKRLF